MTPCRSSALYPSWWTSFPSTGGVVVSNRTLSAALHILGGRRRKARMIHRLFHWCRRRGSDPHRRKARGILSPLRLPVPPLRRISTIGVPSGGVNGKVPHLLILNPPNLEG